MSVNTKETRPWRQRVTDRYRLIILNDETLKETGNYKLTLMNLYVLACTLFLIIGILVFLLLSYTPLKHTIPGYGDIKATPEFLSLRDKTEKLENEITALQNYINANKNRILGNTQNIDNKMLKGAYEPNTINSIEIVEANEETEVKKNQDIRFFYPPITGEISSQYNRESRHLGVDVLSQKNTPITSINSCLLYTSPSPRDRTRSRMPSSA